MKDIYIPNLLRIEKYKEYMGDITSNIPYIIDYDVNNPEQFSAIVSISIATILENIMIFDRVYLDIIELPVILNEMLKIDCESTLQIIENSNISYIDIKDLKVTTRKVNTNYNIVAFGSSKDIPKNCLELEKYLESYFGADDVCFNKLKPYIKNIFENRKTCVYDYHSLTKEIVHAVDEELKSGLYSCFGVGVNGIYFVTDNNKGFFDAICMSVRNKYITKIFNIYAYHADDILRFIISKRYEDYISYGEELNKLINFNKIPDFKSLYLLGKLDINDFLKIRNSKKFKEFKNWLFNNVNTDSDIAQEFCATLMENKADTIPMKSIRLMSSTALGAIPIVGIAAGLIAGAIDTFFVSDIINGISPQKFIKDLDKKTKKSPTLDSDKFINIEFKYNPNIEIDNTQERELDKYMIIKNKLVDYYNSMSENNESNAIQLCQEASILFSKNPHIITLITFLKCNLKLSYISPKNSPNCTLVAEQLYASNNELLSNQEFKEIYFSTLYNTLYNIQYKHVVYDQNSFLINRDMKLFDEFIEFCKKIPGFKST